jgi:hypothetical protein
MKDDNKVQEKQLIINDHICDIVGNVRDSETKQEYILFRLEYDSLKSGLWFSTEDNIKKVLSQQDIDFLKSTITPDFELGKYRHFKGKDDEVLDVARDLSTSKEHVLYKNLYNDPKFGHNPLWVRPKEMFFEHVDKPEYNDYHGPRFLKIKE